MHPTTGKMSSQKAKPSAGETFKPNLRTRVFSLAFITSDDVERLSLQGIKASQSGKIFFCPLTLNLNLNLTKQEPKTKAPTPALPCRPPTTTPCVAADIAQCKTVTKQGPASQVRPAPALLSRKPIVSALADLLKRPDAPVPHAVCNSSRENALAWRFSKARLCSVCAAGSAARGDRKSVV